MAQTFVKLCVEADALHDNFEFFKLMFFYFSINGLKLLHQIKFFYWNRVKPFWFLFLLEINPIARRRTEEHLLPVRHGQDQGREIIEAAVLF